MTSAAAANSTTASVPTTATSISSIAPAMARSGGPIRSGHASPRLLVHSRLPWVFPRHISSKRGAYAGVQTVCGAVWVPATIRGILRRHPLAAQGVATISGRGHWTGGTVGKLLAE
jgi:hypothetical protein